MLFRSRHLPPATGDLGRDLAELYGYNHGVMLGALQVARDMVRELNNAIAVPDQEGFYFRGGCLAHDIKLRKWPELTPEQAAWWDKNPEIIYEQLTSNFWNWVRGEDLYDSEYDSEAEACGIDPDYIKCSGNQGGWMVLTLPTENDIDSTVWFMDEAIDGFEIGRAHV